MWQSSLGPPDSPKHFISLAHPTLGQKHTQKDRKSADKRSTHVCIAGGILHISVCAQRSCG